MGLPSSLTGDLLAREVGLQFESGNTLKKVMDPEGNALLAVASRFATRLRGRQHGEIERSLVGELEACGVQVSSQPTIDGDGANAILSRARTRFRVLALAAPSHGSAPPPAAANTASGPSSPF